MFHPLSILPAEAPIFSKVKEDERSRGGVVPTGHKQRHVAQGIAKSDAEIGKKRRFYVLCSCRYIIASTPRFSKQRGQSSPASFQTSSASHSPASANADREDAGSNSSRQMAQIFIALFSIPIFTTLVY
jgi:hypothetical protein